MQEHAPLLPGIRSPQDLRRLSIADLNRLAGEIRNVIVSTVSSNGGHLASNLGVVELTISLHRVFNSPDDKIVWDVGHQCYTHKLLTGRYASFPTLRKSSGLAGFPKLTESVHDSFNTGHASTSISAALGMLAAEENLGTGNRVVAVIGDGALTGGLAYEALSHAGQLALPLVVILNDNKMSIGPNVGGLSKYLSRLSMKAKYQTFRRTADYLVKKIPLVGDSLFHFIVRLKRAVKAIFYIDNFFVDLGFEYVGPIEGHHMAQLIQVIQDAKNLNKAVVIHVITQKGKGYGFAEDDPGSYHGVSAFPIALGLEKHDPVSALPAASSKEETAGRTFTQVFANAVLEAGQRDERVMAITAAMAEGTGLSLFRESFPKRFFDVGIAEEHAVTFSAGLASRGFRPVTAIYSTFIQRASDQLIHDVCLQNLPVIFALDRSGLVNDDGETHQGIFDISLFRSSPNMTILAPAGAEELVNILRWALGEKVKGDVSSGPVIIRYPKTLCPSGDPAFSFPLEWGRGVWVRHSARYIDAVRAVCIAFTGSLYPQVLRAAVLLEKREIEADLYNLRFLKPVDEDYLAAVMNQYELVIFAEEGCLSGGFGEYASALALRRNCTCRVLTLGVKEKFDALGKRDELLRRNGLDGESIADAAEGVLLGRKEGVLVSSDRV